MSTEIEAPLGGNRHHNDDLINQSGESGESGASGASGDSGNHGHSGESGASGDHEETSSESETSDDPVEITTSDTSDDSSDDVTSGSPEIDDLLDELNGLSIGEYPTALNNLITKLTILTNQINDYGIWENAVRMMFERLPSDQNMITFEKFRLPNILLQKHTDVNAKVSLIRANTDVKINLNETSIYSAFESSNNTVLFTHNVPGKNRSFKLLRNTTNDPEFTVHEKINGIWYSISTLSGNTGEFVKNDKLSILWGSALVSGGKSLEPSLNICDDECSDEDGACDDSNHGGSDECCDDYEENELFTWQNAMIAAGVVGGVALTSYLLYSMTKPSRRKDDDDYC